MPGVISGVTGRLLPRRLCLDACDEFCVIDKVFKEFVAAFRRCARVAKRILQFVDTVIGQGGDCFILAGIDADDRAGGQAVVVTDDGSG